MKIHEEHAMCLATENHRGPSHSKQPKHLPCAESQIPLKWEEDRLRQHKRHSTYFNIFQHISTSWPVLRFYINSKYHSSASEKTLPIWSPNPLTPVTSSDCHKAGSLWLSQCAAVSKLCAQKLQLSLLSVADPWSWSMTSIHSRL